MTTDLNPLSFDAWIGIDWADQEHAVCLIDATTGQRETRALPQQAEAIDAWMAELRQRFPGPLAVCLEQSKGALIYALMKYDFLVLYPINPKQLARYRDALSPSGAKDDPADARLLAEFLQHYQARLRGWHPDDEATRLIRVLSEDRRTWIDLRTQLTNRLQARLKLYFPVVLALFRQRTKMHAPVVCELLLRWGNLAELQQADPTVLEAFFKLHHLHDKSIQEYLVKITAATPLCEDPAIIQSSQLCVQALARQLLEVGQAIAECEAKLEGAMQTHPDASLFTELPGAGDALAPRLLVAFGSDRERLHSADDLQAYSGVAPITKRSGKMQCVLRRWAGPKFLRQTFHEFASCSRTRSTWAGAYYQMQRARGKKHHAAVRALAFKWIRVLYACWKTSTPYNEFQYLQQLRQRQSPLIEYLTATNHATVAS